MQAVLPEQAKVSGTLRFLLNEMRQDRSDAHSHPKWLENLRLHVSEGGQIQVVLLVDRPAFTTVKRAFCAECPERAEAINAAGAWAQSMRDGLAAALALDPGE